MICLECNRELDTIGDLSWIFRCPTKLGGDNSGSSHFIVKYTTDKKNAELIFYKRSDNHTQGYYYSLEYDTEFESCNCYDYDDKFLISIKISFNKLCELIKLDYASFLERIKLYQTFS